VLLLFISLSVNPYWLIPQKGLLKSLPPVMGFSLCLLFLLPLSPCEKIQETPWSFCRRTFVFYGHFHRLYVTALGLRCVQTFPTALNPFVSSFFVTETPHSSIDLRNDSLGDKTENLVPVLFCRGSVWPAYFHPPLSTDFMCDTPLLIESRESFVTGTEIG